jgi:hypothetical protein
MNPSQQATLVELTTPHLTALVDKLLGHARYKRPRAAIAALDALTALGLFEYETTDRIVQLVRTRRTRVAVAALKALGRAAKIAAKCAD